MTAINKPHNGQAGNGSPNAVAIVGMGCKFPGADSVEEYWRVLDSGLSMVTEPPSGRFPTRDHKRSSDKSVFLGNFLNDVSSFDHKFFKKSSREAASMDPQQRLLLEVAYQALASSGHFGPQEQNQDLDMGCFVGLCASDYNDNVACHPANAYSSLGTLRAFITGKVSHFFGLTGPSITYDTACSSSAVAIDAACKAILHGDCTSALAGGVSIFSSPYFYQNLAAASFLSHTGASKSFDAAADGYCRGEGIGLVVLKDMAKAIADGDNIIGTILSTSVKQSSNRVPITVPHSTSQTDLYRKVLKVAGVTPEEVSYLEAHGTGTPVGDPLEFEGIKEVFCTPNRQSPLYFASVKGNIGHTEGASGVAGLIKTLLMMQNKAIPRQASFTRLNPKIKLPAGQLEIPTETVPWKNDTLIACVNNYGAAGSMAAMLVQGPNAITPIRAESKSLSKYPIAIYANGTKSLADNCRKLQRYISAVHPSPAALADVAFNLSYKQNRSLPNMFITAVSNIAELDEQLQVAASNPESQRFLLNSKPNPVVLIFGGQTSRFVGLNQNVFDESVILRKYLDECNDVLKGFGHQGIYPEIFSTEAINDVVLLHSMQFALAYACAQSWIANGLKVDCVVGHSFGQLVALTVSGVFSLADGLKLVYGRAALMADKWGSERGSMIALDSDIDNTMNLLSSVQKANPSSGLEIACYNGSSSHVLVGSATEIDSVVEVIKTSTPNKKYKKLDVSYGFHSRFTDAIVPDLEKLAATLKYNTPKIPIETCSRHENWSLPTPNLIANHTRSPVYFEDAIKRIEARYKSCTWIEAGSNSSVTSMVRRAVSDGTKHILCPINLTRHDALGALADTTTNLWKNGHEVQFWPFHRIQRESYQPLNLPPYQFEKTQHWLEFISHIESPPAVTSDLSTDALQSRIPEPEPVLIAFSGFDDSNQRQAVFTIDPRSVEWKTLVEGHAVLQQPLCPAPLYMELVLQAGKELAAVNNISATPYGTVQGLEITSSLGISQDKIVKLVLDQLDHEGYKWNFAFQAQPRGTNDPTKFSTIAVGKLDINSSEDITIAAEFDRAGRLLRYQKFDEIASHPDGEAVQGSLVYKVFSRVVTYHEFYKGVRHVAGHDQTVVAQVSLPQPQPAITQSLISNPVAIDNFFQVSGLYANCLSPCAPDEVNVCTRVDRVQISEDWNSHQRSQWKVFATSTPINEKECNNDVFVLDQDTGKVVFLAFGVRFNRVRIASLAKVLSRANEGRQTVKDESNAIPTNIAVQSTFNSATARAMTVVTTGGIAQSIPQAKTPQNKVSHISTAVVAPAPLAANIKIPGIEQKLRELLSKITDVPAAEFQGAITLPDLGIDSLMVTEIVSEIDAAFGISIPQEDLEDLQTFAALCKYIDARQIHNNPRTSANHEEPQISSLKTTITTSNQQVDTPQPDLAKSSKQPDQYEILVSRLAKLLGSHLECAADVFERSTNLADQGLDSLLCMELMSDVEKDFGVTIDLAQLTTESNFGELVDILINAAAPGLSAASTNGSTAPTSTPLTPTFEGGHRAEEAFGKVAPSNVGDISNAPAAFEATKGDFDRLADEYSFTGFYKKVFPKHSQLVLAYTVETFSDLGINLAEMSPGEEIPQLNTLPKHIHMREALLEVLRDAEIADWNGKSYLRSDKPIDPIRSTVLYQEILQEFPQHAQEHMLLNLCGAELGNLLSGKKDPLTVLFGSKKNRDILESVYSTSPMYALMSQLLSNFLEKTLSTATPGPDGIFHILELGAGTGSTTKWVVERLTRRGIPIEYTFTDISSSLVSAGKRKFSKYDCMKYATINIEKEPPAQFQGQFDIVLSTNCIHATSNLRHSLNNINKLLRPQGFVSVVEFTNRMFWFDIVFGLLEGWWLFDDGRPYVLATPEFWQKSMEDSGFQHVAWTGGSTRESELVRVITGFKQPVDNPALYSSIPQERTSGRETVVFKHTDKKLPLRADIYYPSPSQASAHSTWTVGLMVHGGGHCLLSRKDVRPKQTQLLLNHGVLPVSIDYRLVPECTILEGALVDVSDAYAWARNTLPSLKFKESSLKIERDRVVVVGWSTGGTLAMSLAWTSIPRGLPPPEAILVFYCPTNYEDEFWQKRNVPVHSEAHSNDTFNILEGVQKEPIAAYNIDPKYMATGGWMTAKDPRSRIVLHMNWNGQTLPVLFRGLPSAEIVGPNEAAKYAHMEQPAVEEIVKASPYAQIVKGNYKSPTHIVFTTKDDLIPWQQAQKTADALRDAGIDSGLTLLDDAPHLFDMYRDVDGKRWEAVLEGYRFLLGKIGKSVD